MGTVLLIHAGIADRTMWRPQIGALEAAGHRVLAPDLRGFGEHELEPAPFSYVRDVEALLDGPTAVVGNSLGGRVALELAVLRPDLVDRLVAVAPGMPGWAWSDETRAGWAAEETAYEAGDPAAAAEASVHQWIDGPRRTSEDIDPAMRSAVTEMVLRSYAMQHAGWEGGAEEEAALDPPVNERLGEIGCPTLVVVGDEDITDMQGIAAHVADSIGGAQLVHMADASHLPSLERPGEFNDLLLGFLDER